MNGYCIGAWRGGSSLRYIPFLSQFRGKERLVHSTKLFLYRYIGLFCVKYFFTTNQYFSVGIEIKATILFYWPYDYYYINIIIS